MVKIYGSNHCFEKSNRIAMDKDDIEWKDIGFPENWYILLSV